MLLKVINSKECIVCHYWYFNNGFKFQNSFCNGCHRLTMLCLSLSDVAIITVKGVDYHCIIHEISKSATIHLLENSVLDYLVNIKCLPKRSILKIESTTIILTINQSKNIRT